MSMALTALANQIAGKSDKEVLQIARLSIGVEPLLEAAWERLAEAIDPSSADEALVAWKLVATADPGDDEVYDFVLVVEDGDAWYERGEEANADVWLESSVPDFFRLLLQLVDWDAAFGDGRLTVRGDLDLLVRVGGMFPTAAPTT